LKIEEIHQPFTVGDICLLDNDYSEIFFLPDGETWCLTAIYDANDDIVEWYFDITRKNAVDEDGKPYCDDLYLDAALLPNGQVLILDEDELKDALDNRKITQEDFDLAYATLNWLKRNKILKVAFMEKLCERLKLLLE